MQNDSVLKPITAFHAVLGLIWSICAVAFFMTLDGGINHFEVVAVVAGFLCLITAPLAVGWSLSRRNSVLAAGVVAPWVLLLFIVIGYGEATSYLFFKQNVVHLPLQYFASLVVSGLFYAVLLRLAVPTMDAPVTLGCANPPIRLGSESLWVIALMPAFVTFMTWLMAPGYMVFCTQHPIARIVYLGAWIWSFIGVVLLCQLRSRSRFRFAIYMCSIWVIFSLPVYVAPMIGPSTTSILQAVGPVTSGD